MIVTCERCAARYKLDDSKIKGRGARITCPKCQHVFVVYNQAQAEAPPEAEEDHEDPSEDEPEQPASSNPLAQDPDSDTGLVGTARRADQLDYRKVGISTWKVKVKIGLVYDFSDIGTLRKYIQDRRVTDDDVISHDGTNWVRIGDIPDLDAYFVQVYEELEEQLTGGAVDPEADTGEEFEDDGPTMVVGMGSLRSNISTGVFQRPGVKTDNAPPSTRPLPGKPAGGSSSPGPASPAGPAGPSDSNRFVDPFESLKERQRDRMRAKRHGDGTSNGAKRKKGKGKGASAGGKSRNLWLIAAAVMGLLAVVWYFFLREPAPSVDVTPPGPVVVVPETPGLSPEEERAALLAELQRKMREAGVEPVLDGSVPEMPEAVTAINPEKRAEMCAKGALPASSCTDVGSTPRQPDPVAPPNNGAARTTAADHAAIGRNAAAQRNWSAAVRAYGEAVNMDRGNGTYRWGLAESCYYGGELERAQGEFQTVLAGNKRAHKFLGLIDDQFGDPAGAVEHLRQYDAAYPGDAAVKAKLQELTGG